ncbi:heme o synthase [Novosphingobium sp. Chol11]|uniref:heme o synthase n=1 Tax=Novosphingobium sp. Chol11 TaxID=1385763 RepID=UPI00260023B6|nr:heme o synthase [Novosphingobium sp. Chol11]
MSQAKTAALPTDWRDFYALTKPRVMTLVIFTGICGMLAAPGSIHPVLGFTAMLCIAVGAAGSAALNQWWEADLDAGMKRTAQRPIPAGRMDPISARDFGGFLAGASVLIMGLVIGWLAAAILAFSIFYYAWIYTVWLKPRTPQNIVIGGGAGAFPPLIGWVAVTGDITLMPILLFLIIFVWTPPHFWALALFVQTDYANVGIPMMPVVAGVKSTRHQILGYAVLLLPLTLVPWYIGGAGNLYGISALVLSSIFLFYSAQVGLRNAEPGDKMKPEKRLFAYSIFYLFILFGALVVDRFATLNGIQS